MKNFDIKQWRFNHVIMENILYEPVNEARWKKGEKITITTKSGETHTGTVEVASPLVLKTGPDKNDTIVKFGRDVKKVVKESINEGKNSAVWTSPKTGKSYDIQKNGNRWEMDIMKKGSSIYDKVTTIKRKTPQELKDWLDGYKIDSQWMEHLLESVNEGEKEALLGDPEKYGLKE